MPRLVLAFAVTDMAAGASAPLPLFRQLLQDEAAGSLLDHLRVRGLCDGVRLLTCYQNADQGIVALVFSLLPGGVTRGGEIAALRELPPRSLRHYAGLADAALARLSPMQQLRARAGALIPPATPPVSPQACPSAPWTRWLAQLDARAPLQLSIAADLPGRAVISQGFSLRLGDDGATQSAHPSGAPSGHSHAIAAGLKTESHPPPDTAFRFFPFPAPKAPVLQPDRAVRLRYLPAPRRRAVLLLRPQTAGHWDERLGYGIQCALRPVAGALAHRGGLLSFQPEAGCWTLLLSAAPAQMSTALAHIIDRLRSLTAYDIQQGLWRRQAHRWHMEAEIPARALLHALSLWLSAPLSAADERPLSPESISIDAMRWEALLYGGESDAVARLLARFPGSVVPPARQAPAPRPPACWLEVNTANPEAALLLFCPAPARSVPANAAWRLLALLYQPRFFQRLRVDQQIGYIVSCRFYTAAEQDGILFILQSPRCNAAALYAHLLAFLTDMSATLATLPAAELAALNASLTQSLGQPPADNLAQAKANWHEDGRQRHARLVQAATALTPRTLLRYHQRLLRENERWWRLSNQRPSP